MGSKVRPGRSARNLGRRKRCFVVRQRKTEYLQWNTRDVIFVGINGDNLGAPWGSNPSPPANSPPELSDCSPRDWQNPRILRRFSLQYPELSRYRQNALTVF
jgi:hypothetical protein